MIFKVGDIVVSKEGKWNPEDVGKKGVVIRVLDNGLPIVKMLEPMPGKCGIDHHWWISRDYWRLSDRVLFRCKSLL